jgi:hypothetical protein
VRLEFHHAFQIFRLHCNKVLHQMVSENIEFPPFFHSPHFQWFTHSCCFLWKAPMHQINAWIFHKGIFNYFSRDSSVGVSMGYRLDGQGLVPGKCKIFFFTMRSKPALGHTQSPIRWVPGEISPGIKRPGREADYSPPSSAEVKNGGAISSLPVIPSWHTA